MCPIGNGRPGGSGPVQCWVASDGAVTPTPKLGDAVGRPRFHAPTDAMPGQGSLTETPPALRGTNAGVSVVTAARAVPAGKPPGAATLAPETTHLLPRPLVRGGSRRRRACLADTATACQSCSDAASLARVQEDLRKTTPAHGGQAPGSRPPRSCHKTTVPTVCPGALAAKPFPRVSADS